MTRDERKEEVEDLFDRASRYLGHMLEERCGPFDEATIDTVVAILGLLRILYEDREGAA